MPGPPTLSAPLAISATPTMPGPPIPSAPVASHAHPQHRASGRGNIFRFTAADDLVIAREVAASKAHIAPYGTISKALRRLQRTKI